MLVSAPQRKLVLGVVIQSKKRSPESSQNGKLCSFPLIENNLENIEMTVQKVSLCSERLPGINCIFKGQSRIPAEITY